MALDQNEPPSQFAIPRKPLPAAIDSRDSSINSSVPNAEKAPAVHESILTTRDGSRFGSILSSVKGFYVSYIAKYLPDDKRKRRYVLAGIVAGAIALLALIIGLAVGLTVGRQGASNLPLPTDTGGPYVGDLTYYTPALGACGYTNTDSDAICAVSHVLFDAAQTGSNPNLNPLCGAKLRLRRNGKTVDVTVVDRCVGCAATDIDTTTSVFEKLAEIDQGRVLVEWAWLDAQPLAMPEQ
ncbi:hypothetical protein VTN49DRAFT_6311 [Thermomyces lanuginosus]|uniref:uncharacterized protein n=1 Tax=Thermomyces lanuginosus TaxID=5541 RepID=UPI0037427428